MGAATCVKMVILLLTLLKIFSHTWTSCAGIEASSTAEDAAQMAETRQKYLPMPNLLCVQETVTGIKLAYLVT